MKEIAILKDKIHEWMKKTYKGEMGYAESQIKDLNSKTEQIIDQKGAAYTIAYLKTVLKRYEDGDEIDSNSISPLP